MRTFKLISITVLTIFIILVIALNVVMIKQQNHTDGQYRVEVKRLADEIEETGSYNPANYSFIKGVYTGENLYINDAPYVIIGLSEEDIREVSIHRQFSKKVYRNGIESKENKIPVKIDVLLIVNKSVPVIIEDKVFTSEHDDQINHYVEGIRELVNQNNGKLIVNPKDTYDIDLERIQTVFWKTGFWYDADKVVIADKFFSVKDILGLLEPYSDESEILSHYIASLKDAAEWFGVHKNYWELTEQYYSSHWDLNVAKHEIAQYSLMREFFSESLWEKKKGKKYEKYQIYSGSSSGRPWTEMIIHDGVYKQECHYKLFWRIDTDSKAPYISLRLYEPEYRAETKIIHRELWETMTNAIKTIVDGNELGIEWGRVDPGDKRNCNEAAIFHYRFYEDVRRHWNEQKSGIIKMIRSINSLFLEWIEAYMRDAK